MLALAPKLIWNGVRSLRKINMEPRTRIVKIKRHIASLIVWQFVGAQFLTFWDSDSLQWRWNWHETCLWLPVHIFQPERRICIERKYILKLAEFMASLTASCLVLMFLYSIRALKLDRFFFLLLLFHWNCFFVVHSSSHLVACLSAWAEISFWLHGIFFPG